MTYALSIMKNVNDIYPDKLELKKENRSLQSLAFGSFNRIP